MTQTQFMITDDLSGQRIDVAAAACSGLTRSRIQALIEDGALTLNSLAVKTNHRVSAGDTVLILIEEQADILAPENIPLSVLFRDEWLAVIDKPAGLVMYPAAGHANGTLMNGLAFLAGHLSAPGGPLRPGVVHRIDKDTSGVVVVALKDEAYYPLVEMFKDRTIERRYASIVYGAMKADAGEISSAIGRSDTHRKKMSTQARRGKSALTVWRVRERFRDATLIEARLGTGRTHQIRVHLASIGHPVAGDRVYGNKTSLRLHGRSVAVPRQMLHAELLGFRHPVTGIQMRFESRMPDDMSEVLRLLKEDMPKSDIL